MLDDPLLHYVREHVSAAAWEAGLDYWVEGYVELDEAVGDIVSASVQSPRSARYEVELQWDGTELAANCNCRSRYLCKHIAATAIEARLGDGILEADEWGVRVDDGEPGYFSFRPYIRIDEEQIDILPALVGAIREARLRGERLEARDDLAIELDDGREVSVPLDRVQGIIDVIVELAEEVDLGGVDLELPELVLAQLADAALDEWTGDREVVQRLRDLEELRSPKKISPPRGLKAKLRDYQLTGLGWLQFLLRLGLGGILADDMGLGKTLETIAHMLTEIVAGRATGPSLVVAPRTLVYNWLREFRRFAPQLNVVLYHGPTRTVLVDDLCDADVVITTYGLLRLDDEILELDYHIAALDEGQAIKNHRCQTARRARELSAAQRLILTGTPVQNTLAELHSLMDFVLPGALGSRKQFGRRFRGPIEKEHDETRRRALQRRVEPFMLRRTKEEVLAELPPKIFIEHYCELDGKQRDLYEAVRLSTEAEVRKLLAQKGLDRGRQHIFTLLTRLRQACCHTRLTKLERARGIDESSKLEALIDLLDQLVPAGHRVVVFSQWTEMLGLIGQAVTEAGYGYLELTGKTRRRQEVVDAFQSGAALLFLVSLKAGGEGLNLTAGDTAVIFEPSWNPANEDQAIDRLYRIGQERPVTVYRLIAPGTMEEVMRALGQRKRALARSVQTLGRATELTLTRDDLLQILAPLEDGWTPS